MRQKVFIVLAVVWMVVIFVLSGQNANESSQMSMGVGEFVGQVFVEDFESWTDEAKSMFVDSVEHPIRKLAHASEYTILGFLLMGATNFKVPWALALGVLYAASDEFHQRFVPGRSGQITDVMIDSGGVILGILIFYLGRRIICEKKKKS